MDGVPSRTPSEREENPMTKEQDPENAQWDREQWAKDEPVDKSSTDQGKTWERHEWASDEKHPDSPGPDVTTPTGHAPGETGPTGRGMPPGEGHWERVDQDS
jgi:hypothetical protein